MKTLTNTFRSAAFVMALFVMLGFVHNTNAQLVNPGFETGDLTGWSAAGTAYASTGEIYNAWIVTPSGSYMGFVSPPGGPSRDGAEALLGLTPGAFLAHNNDLYSGTTNWGLLYQDVLLGAGQSVTIFWNFISTDYAPFNDGTVATFTGPSTQEILTLSVTSTAYGEPGVIIVGDFGSSGWHSTTFTAPVAGTYRVGFSGFNLLDTALDPWKMIDEAPGGTAAPGQPTVFTNPASLITQTTAVSGGEVVSGAGTPAITARGVCWNTTGVPTTSDDITVDGSGFGTFTSNLTGLVPGTTYYVRAYATNSEGTFYGGQVTFTTLGGEPSVPISNWALYLGILFMVSFVVIRFRRMI